MKIDNAPWELYKKVNIPFNAWELQNLYTWRFGKTAPENMPQSVNLSDKSSIVVLNGLYEEWGLTEEFKKLGLKPTEFGLYIIKPGSFEPPHKDCTMTGEVREWALNFPVLNCDKGRTVWISEEPDEYEDTNSNFNNNTKTFYQRKKTRDIGRQIDSIVMDGAYLIRTDVPHTIDNRYSDGPRVVLTYRFNDISWDEITNII